MTQKTDSKKKSKATWNVVFGAGFVLLGGAAKLLDIEVPPVVINHPEYWVVGIGVVLMFLKGIIWLATLPVKFNWPSYRTFCTFWIGPMIEGLGIKALSKAFSGPMDKLQLFYAIGLFLFGGMVIAGARYFHLANMKPVEDQSDEKAAD